MFRRGFTLLGVILALLWSGTAVYAAQLEESEAEYAQEEAEYVQEEAEYVPEESELEYEGATEYPMILDKVEGANIETFYIERPNPEALKNNIVNASTFGLSVDKEDNYDEFSAALSYCKQHPNTYLVIDQGRYYFKTNASLQLRGLKNVLIEGNGSEFIFETQKQFAINECDGLEIRNLVVDWNWDKDRVASLVRIQNKTDNSFEIKFLELDDVDENIPIVSFQQYDGKDLVPGSYGGYRSFAPAEKPGSIVSVEKIEPNVLKIVFSKEFTTSFHNEDVYILRHYTYGGAVFNVAGSSRNITFDNVRIYGSAGMGFVFGYNTNHFQIINSYIGLRPGHEDKQRMSTSADGIHILNTDGYFRIDNCDLSFTGDDIINIHDDIMKVEEAKSNTVFGKVTGGFVSKGEKVRIYNKELEDIGFETEVIDSVRGDFTATLTLKDNIPSEVGKGYFVYRSSEKTHNYVISNNYIHETKGRGALINAPDGLFENNRMYRTAADCVQVRVDIYEKDEKKFWYEGSGANNIVINNNIFEECSFGGDPSIIRIDCNSGNNTGVLSDIHITNNKFYYCYGAVIDADNVTDLYIEGNLISDCDDIKISNYCGYVYNNGNTITYPSESCPHTDTKKIQDRAAGCFEYGSTGKIYCNLCHTIIDHNYRGIPPLKHKNMQVKRIDVAPTCTSDGSSSTVCTGCRTVIETDVVEPATGHNYVDGVCTLCGDGKQVSVNSMSLELNTERVDYIGINLYVDAPEGTVFYLDGKSLGTMTRDSKGLYKIQVRSAPKEIFDKHVIKAKDSANNAVKINGNTEYSYSGDMYCKLALADDKYSAELKNVCQSLLDYSEQARSYFGYNTSGLSVGNISANIPTTGYAMKATGILPKGNEYLGSSLILGDELTLRHYFTGSSKGLTITCTDATKRKSNAVAIGSTNSGSTGAGSADSETGMYVDIKVPYSDIGDMFELKVTASGQNTSYTLDYGVLTYCQKAHAKNADSKLTNLCNALYNFSSAISKLK